MEKPLVIKRIDLLVHPFYGLTKEKQGDFYSKKNVNYLVKLWKKHIDEVARDPSRLLFIKLITPVDKPLKETASEIVLLKRAKTKEIVEYAKKKLKKRFGFYESTESKFAFYDYLENGFKGFKKFAKAKGFEVDPKKVKTRGLGEYTTACVMGYLQALNKNIGLKNTIPYRNYQSTVMPRKSIELGVSYPMPWKLKSLLKSNRGKKILRKKIEDYIKKRRETANREARKQPGKARQFKPRPHLMKRKRKP